MTELDPIIVEVKGKIADVLKDIAEAKAALHGLGDEAEKSGGKTSASSKKAGKDIDDFSRLVTAKLKDGQTAFTSMTKEVEKTRKSIEGMKKEFAKTGNHGLFGEIRAAEADLKKMQGYLDGMTQSTKKAKKEAEGLGKSLMLMAVAASPFLLPLVGGSLLAVLGAGGLALGIATQFNAPAVVAARSKFKTDTGLAIHAATAPFAAELASSFGILDQGVVEFFQHLAPGLNALAPELSTISHDISDGLVKAGPILASAFEKSKPVVDAVGKAIETIIVDTSTMFNRMSFGAKGEADAISGITEEVGRLLKELGTVVGVAGKVFGVIVDGEKKVNDAIGGVGGKGGTALRGLKEGLTDIINPAAAVQDGLDHLGKWIDSINAPTDHAAASLGSLTRSLVDEAHVLGTARSASDLLVDSTGKLALNYDALASQMSTTKQTADTLAGAMADSVFKTLMSNDEATLHWYESLTSLSKALKTNKDALNIHTRAGQADREAVLASVQANIQQYDTMIQSGMSAQQAAAAYDKNAAALRQQLHDAGLTKHQIDGLIGSYDKVPDTVNTTIVLQGMSNAIQSLVDLQKQLNGLYVPNLALTASQGHDIYGGGGDQGSGRSTKKPPAKPKPPSTKKPPPLLHGAQRLGGIDFAGVRAFANAGIAEGSGLGLIRWAEAATRREAYIPQVGDRNRAVGTLREAARWHDMEVRPMSAGYFPSMTAGPAAYVPIVVMLGGVQMAAVHAQLIPVAQQYKLRGGTTGLS
jgi:hypothetical protein